MAYVVHRLAGVRQILSNSSTLWAAESVHCSPLALPSTFASATASIDHDLTGMPGSAGEGIGIASTGCASMTWPASFVRRLKLRPLIRAR
jgi:hypothetical protein